MVVDGGGYAVAVVVDGGGYAVAVVVVVGYKHQFFYNKKKIYCRSFFKRLF